MNMTILIPSYEPEEKLVGYVDDLASCGFKRIVVVNDGSGEPYREIFDRLNEKPSCTVLHHDVNKGKGAALKTGYAYIHEHQSDSVGVVTADADGQHSSDDCVRMANALVEDGALVCQAVDIVYQTVCKDYCQDNTERGYNIECEV